MKLTSRQKVLLIVFGVAVAAFVVDRVYPGLGAGRPKEAEASVGMDIGAILPESAAAFPEDAILEVPPNGWSVLAGRLETAASTHQLSLDNVRDAFHPALSWVGKPQEKKKAQKQLAPSNENRVQEFLKNHRLQAVVVADGGGGAIINGRYLTIGQEIGGFTLVSVNKSSVALMRGRLRVVLRLAGGAVDDSG